MKLADYWYWNDDEGLEVFQDVLEPYGAPNRHYHNQDHLLFMFRAPFSYDGLREQKIRSLFVFYHDHIYLASSTNNEFISSMCLAMDSFSLHEHGEELDTARLAIELSTHLTKTDDQLIGQLLDSDLFILASDPQDYDLYASNVRKEYLVYSDEEWKQGRIKFLNSTLDLPKIFNSTLYQQYEERARQNIQREIQILGG